MATEYCVNSVYYTACGLGSLAQYTRPATTLLWEWRCQFAGCRTASHDLAPSSRSNLPVSSNCLISSPESVSNSSRGIGQQMQLLVMLVQQFGRALVATLNQLADFGVDFLRRLV